MMIQQPCRTEGLPHHGCQFCGQSGQRRAAAQQSSVVGTAAGSLCCGTKQQIDNFAAQRTWRAAPDSCPVTSRVALPAGVGRAGLQRAARPFGCSPDWVAAGSAGTSIDCIGGLTSANAESRLSMKVMESPAGLVSSSAGSSAHFSNDIMRKRLHH